MKTGTYKTEDEYYIEEAIRFLVTHLPRNASNKKPVLLHSLRVGEKLQNLGYSRDIVIAGYLHDLIEDSEIRNEEIAITFGETVLQIVLANTKNNNLPREDLMKDVVKRCYNYGKEAVAVKAADILDNYYFYQQRGIESEINRAVQQGKQLIKLLGFEEKNKLITELRNIIDTKQ